MTHVDLSEFKSAFTRAFTQGVIISCQAPEGSPLRDPHVMVRMAEAAQKAGAVAIRAEGVADIEAIAANVTLPIIGIRKKHYQDSDVYITATRSDVDLVADAGAQLVALDATSRERPNGESLAEVIAHARTRSLIVMADLSRFGDAEHALAAGADILGTTLVGASADDVRPNGPNISVVERLAHAYPGIPLIAEGRYASPADVTGALDAGATAVVAGRAVTDSYALARDLVEAADRYRVQETVTR
jgi:N-acylglucosamine-6-phosphate 2-epimerase